MLYSKYGDLRGFRGHGVLTRFPPFNGHGVTTRYPPLKFNGHSASFRGFGFTASDDHAETLVDYSSAYNDTSATSSADVGTIAANVGTGIGAILTGIGSIFTGTRSNPSTQPLGGAPQQSGFSLSPALVGAGVLGLGALLLISRKK